MHAGEKTTHGLDGQHQDVDRTPRGSQSVRMTEDRDKWRKYVHGAANPRIEGGYRTEQNNYVCDCDAAATTLWRPCNVLRL